MSDTIPHAAIPSVIEALSEVYEAGDDAGIDATEEFVNVEGADWHATVWADGHREPAS